MRETGYRPRLPLVWSVPAAGFPRSSKRSIPDQRAATSRLASTDGGLDSQLSTTLLASHAEPRVRFGVVHARMHARTSYNKPVGRGEQPTCIRSAKSSRAPR
jgi:hypothetical protein